MIKIYQQTSILPDFYLMKEEEVQSMVNNSKGLYTHVATIEPPTITFEEVFTIANSEKDPRLSIISNNYRSLSVGDIIKTGDGKWYWCAPAGWYSIEGLDK